MSEFAHIPGRAHLVLLPLTNPPFCRCCLSLIASLYSGGHPDMKKRLMKWKMCFLGCTIHHIITMISAKSGICNFARILAVCERKTQLTSLLGQAFPFIALISTCTPQWDVSLVLTRRTGVTYFEWSSLGLLTRTSATLQASKSSSVFVSSRVNTPVWSEF